LDSLAERVNLLRGVRFFTGAPEEALPTVAEALEPVRLAAGEVLFHKGDVGDSMYVIAGGRLRAHDGELTFNELGPGDVVGEMAVLDAAPRSASVTAVEPTELLCLHQGPLYELIGSHAGVARGVIQILARHLRNRVSDMANDFAYIRQVLQVAAAAQALNDGRYSAESIAEVAGRDDALGELARTFQHMAAELIARERSLRREVQQLRIEIDRGRQQHQVAEITTSDYFRQLQQRAADLRANMGADDE
jgi:CRP-like cAMP-binding protein